MQTPYFTEGQTEPVDPSKAVENGENGNGNGNENEKLDQKKNGQGGEDEGQMYAPMQKRPFDPVESTGHAASEQNSSSGGSSGFSGGVRKILHPAEALDSARQTAELIMKDAMDALIRTKQRLMEILPSLMPSQAAAAAAPDAASKVVENVEQGMLGKAEGGVPAAGTDAEQNGSDEKPSEGVASNASGSNGGLTTNTTTGSVHQSSPDSQSRKKWKVVGLSKI
ncbi:hypothetical protein MPTK1_6g13230 [Marchantia polymorpha subsp. ruderalis]|uniref:Uncharacterized protein n=2 Tax=Marchantia polymorpha TaxID=3197 RepID=A0AAF6BRL1_MARPO|nr:hypothetical protein MARPO_0059s0026 [Marchantia polymorpha]BBN14645.1 hypothetical protein Mp_6g13230 [Marchantia polymorpha subsp. ruderalis]|eukprot:PTQ37074.1 hypothetical protein MARPO_0059s0026 [Marchantia polymorpha]